MPHKKGGVYVVKGKKVSGKKAHALKKKKR